MSSLLELIITIIVLSAGIWAVNQFIPPSKLRRVLTGLLATILAIITVIWLFAFLGIGGRRRF